MRNIIIALIALIITSSCNQKVKEKENKITDSVMVITPETVEEENQLAEVITRFVRAYSSKDNAKANALIHPDLGIYIIYKPGASESFVRKDSLDFSSPIPQHFAYPEFSTEYALTFEKLPQYDCGTTKWDKLGFVCDTTSHPKQLSNIAAFQEEYNEQVYSDQELEELERSEKESYVVIVTQDVDPLVFHVRRYNGAWYVTALDRAYASCDA